jgi:hypothetical protein
MKLSRFSRGAPDANRWEEEVLILVESLEIPMERSRAGISHVYTCQLAGGFARSRPLLTEAQSIVRAS